MNWLRTHLCPFLHAAADAIESNPQTIVDAIKAHPKLIADGLRYVGTLVSAVVPGAAPVVAVVVADRRSGGAVMSAIESLEETLNRLRAEALGIEKDVRWILKSDVGSAPRLPDTFPGQREEVLAHCVLAIRHLEDARMRLGKAIQWSQGGVSIFDAPAKTPAAEPIAAAFVAP
jgi:hypothetical protein